MAEKSLIKKLYHPIPSNSFDLIRLILAGIVVIEHFLRLSGITDWPTWTKILSTHVAVKGFFILSGYLILASYLRNPNLKQYLKKRAKRLLPAYFSIILFFALLLGIFSDYPYWDYITHPQFWRYLGANLIFLNFLEPNLPGVFLNNPFSSAINGALWTLKIEISFYLFIPLFVTFLNRIIKEKNLIHITILLYLLGLSFRLITIYFGDMYPIILSLKNQLPGSIQYFSVGMGLYLIKNKQIILSPYFLLLGIFLFAELYLFQTTFVWPIGLGILILYFGFTFNKAADFLRGKDFSYGIYIIHFPIAQMLIGSQLFNHKSSTTLLLYFSLVALGAFISWTWIESPFLKKRSLLNKK